MRALILFGIIITSLFVTGCTTSEDIEYIQCPEESGGYCIQVYEPVCGSDGKTYSNSCVVCKTVEKYVEGECS